MLKLKNLSKFKTKTLSMYVYIYIERETESFWFKTVCSTEVHGDNGTDDKQTISGVQRIYDININRSFANLYFINKSHNIDKKKNNSNLIQT